MKLLPSLLSSILAAYIHGFAQQPDVTPPATANTDPKASQRAEPFADPHASQLADPFADHHAPQIPPGTRLDKVTFSDANLADIIDFLDRKSQESGGRPLNVVLQPGLESVTIPALSLRNVTTTEVLSVASSILGLSLEPVKGDTGDSSAAWILKRLSPVDPAPVIPLGTATDPNATSQPDTTSTFQPLASSGNPRQTRVFSIASLLPRRSASPEAAEIREKETHGLIISLTDFAKELDKDAEIRHFPSLDLIVAKSSALPLISEAIDAMRSDAAIRYPAATPTSPAPNGAPGQPAGR
jgi:hypothetical protein